MQGSLPFAHINDSVTPPEICPCRGNFNDLRGGHCLQIKNTDCYGTLGYFTRRGREFGILSNYHVTLAPPNRLTSSANTEFPENDHIAVVSQDAFDNKVDATYSRFCDDLPLVPPEPPFMLSDGTVVQGTQRARCWDRVRYCGCTAGCTQPGRIHSTNWCGLVYYPKPEQISGLYKFCNQILFTPASRNGDSGSLLINADTNRATGLVFAGVDNRYGLANPIRVVLNRLGVRLA